MEFFDKFLYLGNRSGLNNFFEIAGQTNFPYTVAILLTLWYANDRTGEVLDRG